ncbi:hypothetical protein LWI28_002827 [Acer negundo]|uniref:BHLH domain-containing protein n=1 Tax=Acer negundo TaxID=4023 RepID=A0AAD5NHY1_ACENE|nr:hypothetical protein LWI28_002827 [Acer negundo]
MDHGGNNLNKIDRKSLWRRKLSVRDMSEEKNTSTEDIKKKMTHKDTEKQRRQEMSTLHASLRSLLPLEYIKGKRSMSDHMNGAVYYINDLKNKIKELSDKRDELIKRVSNSSASSSRRESAGGSRNDHDQPPINCVMIHPCFGGLEIVISSTSFMREQESGGFFVNFDPHLEDFLEQDLILGGQASLEGSNLTTNKVGMGKKYKILSPAENNNDRISNNVLEKKIVRKENERLRRQHMSMLNASLRSLLPLESIKGKRSICDHIDEAVKYINYLNKNIQDLSIKRDKLKNFIDLETDRLSNQLGNNTSSENCVSVRSPYCGGVEIVISCGGLREESCSLLSRALQVVLEEGLDIVQRVSSQTDDGVFHTVQSEGKRSVSDHIHEADKYITHMKKNIQDLSVKRDKLTKNLPDSDHQVIDHGNTSSENCLVNCTVSVHPYCGGVGIVVGGDR